MEKSKVVICKPFPEEPLLKYYFTHPVNGFHGGTGDLEKIIEITRQAQELGCGIKITGYNHPEDSEHSQYALNPEEITKIKNELNLPTPNSEYP
jgi:hypothetical protein